LRTGLVGNFNGSDDFGENDNIHYDEYAEGL